MNSLYAASIELILRYQHPSGAYVASPTFPPYQYCWFRDGSFIAYSMDLAGEHESARRFHNWAAKTILRRKKSIQQTLERLAANLPLRPEDQLRTRYHLNGADEPGDDWPNFQLDGFGTWLWALNEHRKTTRLDESSSDLVAAAGKVADYLQALWQHPCYDCWEEYPSYVHPYTLAAIYAGLRSHEEMTGCDHRQTTEEIQKRLLSGAEPFGHFVKFPDSSAVDASLLGLSVPYRVVSPSDPLMLRTVEQIERTILRSGGLHRYAQDTYYGGGAWILLSAWLGWYYLELSKSKPELQADLAEKTRALKAWIETQAEPTGEGCWLPEQVPQNLNDPTYYPLWVQRWGKIASPLLWSHASYIILASKLEERVGSYTPDT